MSRDVINTAYATYLMTMSNDRPQGILRVFTETVYGEVYSLEDTAVDDATYVSIAIAYTQPTDQSTLSYCRKDELEAWYHQHIHRDKTVMLHSDEPEDGNWSNAYAKLCETTATQILGSPEGWSMDLARFYSDILVGKPTQYLHSMFQRGVCLGDVLGQNVWGEAESESLPCYVHLSRSQHTPSVYEISVYGVFHENTEVIDYEDLKYRGLITDQTILRARKTFEELTIQRDDTVQAVRLPEEQEAIDLLVRSQTIKSLEVAQDAISEALTLLKGDQCDQ